MSSLTRWKRKRDHFLFQHLNISDSFFLALPLWQLIWPKLPLGGNCSNKLLSRKNLFSFFLLKTWWLLKNTRKRLVNHLTKTQDHTWSMIWLATVMISLPLFHNITKPSSRSTMHGNLEIIVVDKDSFGDLMMLIITFMMIMTKTW